jgi:hypothetical protein
MQGLIQCGVVLGLWTIVVSASPQFFAAVYLPGYLAGLALCSLQGHFEHAGGTTSHYGWLYNLLFFNDGYHVEHHRRPGVHWTRLPLEIVADPQPSRWPPVLRWLEAAGKYGTTAKAAVDYGIARPRFLECMEKIALKSSFLQGYVLRVHERAFRALLPSLPTAARITIVGGGLFPRTALILERLRPDADLLIVDACRDHLDVARPFLSRAVEFREQFFDPRSDDGGELVVIPLSFVGNREAVYQKPPAQAALVHDWLWNVRGRGVRVSWLLLKRLNLVVR